VPQATALLDVDHVAKAAPSQTDQALILQLQERIAALEKQVASDPNQPSSKPSQEEKTIEVTAKCETSWCPTATLRTGLTHAFQRREGEDVNRSAAVAFWQECREGRHSGPTAGIDAIKKHVQANLVVVPQMYALDFLLFCLRNPKAAPLLDVTDAGDPHPKLCGPEADLRTDLPRYIVWRDGEKVSEPTDVTSEWQEMERGKDGPPVAFLLGCSFSFENTLADAGLTPRHVEQQCNVPMYKTQVPNIRSGKFGGELVVSMRPYTPDNVPKAAAVTGTFPGAHGAPVQAGNAEGLGIASVEKPDYGDAVDMKPGEEPVFWACGVTPQTAVADAGLPLAITHAPGHMFICDLLEDELRVESMENSDQRPTGCVLVLFAIMFNWCLQ